METEQPGKIGQNADAIADIKTIQKSLCDKLFELEKLLRKEICALPQYMSYILENTLRHIKINERPSQAALQYNLIHLDFVADCLNDEFNTGHWRDVELSKRKGFTIFTCLKILIKLQSQELIINDQYIKSLMKCADLGLLLGAPIEDSDETLLSTVATDLMVYYNKYIKSVEVKLLNCNSQTNIGKEKPVGSLSLPNTPVAENVNNVQILNNPRVEQFYTKYFLNKVPATLLDCMTDWPAHKKWKDWGYFITTCGERTVPVEVGSHYAHENWSQKLMTLRKFITEYMDIADNSDDSIRGYLAQHNLFDQIPELRNDIIIPDFCALSEDVESYSEPEINAWLGPRGTVSPLHYDPKHNILAQVIGSKQVILFDPSDSDYLYPHDELLLSNTAQVDPIKPDLKLFPDYVRAKMWKCELNAGEMLYIPPKWWHHITSLEKSFSVSFWWE